MITVGVKDLKAHLSQYLRLVKAGETVRITEHNRVIAEILLPREFPPLNPVEEFLATGVQLGKIQRATKEPSLPVFVADETDLDWRSILDDLRRERFR
jgi:antitoxin (DNA-binding transcriptional repressor) of toxin-antitoxin stability system